MSQPHAVAEGALSERLRGHTARVSVVGVLDRHRPPVIERVADLRDDLLVCEVGEE